MFCLNCFSCHGVLGCSLTSLENSIFWIFGTFVLQSAMLATTQNAIFGILQNKTFRRKVHRQIKGNVSFSFSAQNDDKTFWENILFEKSPSINKPNIEDICTPKKSFIYQNLQIVHNCIFQIIEFYVNINLAKIISSVCIILGKGYANEKILLSAFW